MMEANGRIEHLLTDTLCRADFLTSVDAASNQESSAAPHARLKRPALSNDTQASQHRVSLYHIVVVDVIRLFRRRRR